MSRKKVSAKEELIMATVSMPHVVINYSDKKAFTRRANLSEKNLKECLNFKDDNTLSLLSMLENGKATVVVSLDEDDNK